MRVKPEILKLEILKRLKLGKKIQNIQDIDGNGRKSPRTQSGCKLETHTVAIKLLFSNRIYTDYTDK